MSEGRHPAGAGLPWHDHANPTFCYVLEGRFEELLRGKVLICLPGTLKYTPAGLPHANRFPAGAARGLMLEVDAAFLEDVASRPGSLAGPRQFDAGLACRMAGTMAHEILADPGLPAVALDGWAVEVIAAAKGAPPVADERRCARWLVDAEAIVREELGSIGGLRDLAERVAVHPVTLARGFRRRFGCSLGEFIRRARVDRAVDLLVRQDRSIAAVAAASGFADQSHMTRVLRAVTGWTPARLRAFLAGGVEH